MKTGPIQIVLLLFPLLLACPAQAGCLASILVGTTPVRFVSPMGRDDWSGTRAQPNESHSDGPFLSLEAARDAVRAIGKPGIIVMEPGDYYLRQTVLFDTRDKGLAIVAACGQAPVLHGGTRLESWTREADDLWTAQMTLDPKQAIGAISVNGVAQTPARYPNAPRNRDPRGGWLFAAKPATGADPWSGNMQFRYHEGDLPILGKVGGLVANIVGGFDPGSQWGSDTLPVTSIDTATDTIHTRGTGYFFTSEGSRYFLTGLEAFLDAPGEWWQDPATGRIRYITLNRSLGAASVVAATLPTFLRLEHADDMVISGLQFRDGTPQGTGKYGTDTRAFGAIRLERSRGVRIVGNVIRDVGVGIHVSESENVLIADNEIANIAGNGIYLGTAYGSFEKSSGARIMSNHIHEIGQVYFESAGIWFQAADNVTIANNRIEDVAQFGIAGGSIWGPQDSVHDVLIENNEIRNANQQTADGGAIKLNGMQSSPLNCIVRSNRIVGTGHLMNRPDGTFWPAGYENTGEWPSPISWAIYTDGRASGIRIEGNFLFKNVSAIGINGGWSNIVKGNQVAQGSGAAFRVDDGTGRGWRPSWALPNRIEDNDVSIDSYNGFSVSIYVPDHGADYVHFAGNRYRGSLNDESFQVRPETMSSGQYGALTDFQAAGEDDGSTIQPLGRIEIQGSHER